MGKEVDAGKGGTSGRRAMQWRTIHGTRDKTRVEAAMDVEAGDDSMGGSW